MAFDAGMAAAVVNELREKTVGAKIEKVFQPSGDEVILVCRRGRDSMRLLLSANPSSARACVSTLEKENPQVPPMFCMQLRKHLCGALITDVCMYGFERVIEIKLSGYDELGFACEKYLVLEIMGKCSNLLMLCNEDGRKKILGLIHPVDFSTSARRQALPGMTYELPPSQDKKDPLSESEQGFAESIKAYPPQRDAWRFVLDTYMGISPLVAREIALMAGAEAVERCSIKMMWRAFSSVMDRIKENTFVPCAVVKDGVPFEYSYIDINQYGTSAEKRVFNSFSEMLDFYFGEREHAETMRAKAHDIKAILSSARHKLQKKLPILRSELLECDEADKFKLWGDLITASIYMLTKKADKCEVTNYYSESLENVVIPLDIKLTPSQNAARYYKKYTKLKTAKKMITEQIQKAESELAYFESVEASLSLAENEADLYEIRIELAEAGYSPKTAMLKKARSHAKFKPKHFVTSGGYECYVGKNNIQNDFITTKLSKKSDWWFHVKGSAGSHVLMVCPPDVEPDARDFTEAAELAAYFSGIRNGENVAVDYTHVRYVKKPAGSPAGFVTYSSNYTAYVDPKCECEEI